MLVEIFGEEPGDYVEIFVMMGGEPARVLPRSGGRTTVRGKIGGEFEFVGTEHAIHEKARGLKTAATGLWTSVKGGRPV
jgi:hypothetical protein